MSVRMSGGSAGRLVRRMRVFARLGKQLDRRSPRHGGVTPEFMRMVDRVVMGAPEEARGAAASPAPNRPTSALHGDRTTRVQRQSTPAQTQFRTMTRNGKKLRVLRALCEDVVELRRGDHSAARLKLEQGRRADEREQTEEEVVAHFTDWAKRPDVRELLLEEQRSPADLEARIREIFGLPPKVVLPAETEAATGGGGPAEAEAANESPPPPAVAGEVPAAAERLPAAGSSAAPQDGGPGATPDDRRGPSPPAPRDGGTPKGAGTVALIRPNPTESDQIRPVATRPAPPEAGFERVMRISSRTMNEGAGR